MIYSAVPDVQLAALKQHIAQKWGNRKCSMCGVARFTIAGYVTFPLSDKVPQLPGIADYFGSPSGNSFLSPLYEAPAPQGLPSAAIVCTNCGNTYFLNLVVAGLAGG